MKEWKALRLWWVAGWLFLEPSTYTIIEFLASQDAQEVILVSESELADLTDVTLVSEDAF